MTLVTLVLLEMMFLISCAHTEIVTVQDRPYNAVGDGVAFTQSQRYQVVKSWAVGPSMRGSTSGTRATAHLDRTML